VIIVQVSVLAWLRKKVDKFPVSAQLDLEKRHMGSSVGCKYKLQ